MRDRLILLGLVVAVCAMYGAWFFLTHELVDVNERGKPNALVRSNPVYGFQQFLERYNVESQRLSTLNTQLQMPDYDDTLVIGFDAVYLNDADNVRVADWVAAGGHLVVPLPYRTDDTLLAYFNIHSGTDSDEEDTAQSEDTALDDSTADDATSGDAQADSQENADVENHSTTDPEDAADVNDSEETEPDELVDRYVYDSSFNGTPYGEFSVSYGVYDDLYSNRDTQWTLELVRKDHDGPEDRRTYALGFQYGLGTVSLLSDYAHWNNNNFFEHDNALMSLAIFSRVRDPGKVWFIQSIQQASLMDLIWSRAAHLILWLALLIALFFWWAGQRVGRVIPNPSLERREFNEHLVASGRFLWSKGQRQKLLNSAQEALLQRARRRYPRLHALGKAQTDMQLKDILNEHYPTWTYAMDPNAPSTKNDFFEQIKAIQTLWKLL